jgi:hypothetical protein
VKLHGTTAANAAVTITTAGITLGQATADVRGNWEANLNLKNLAVGRHDITISLSANDRKNTKRLKLVLASWGIPWPFGFSPWLVVSIALPVMAVVGGVSYYWLRAKKAVVPLGNIDHSSFVKPTAPPADTPPGPTG